MPAVPSPGDRFRLPVRSAAPAVLAGVLAAFFGTMITVVAVSIRPSATWTGLGLALAGSGAALVVASLVLWRRRQWVLWVGAEHLTLTRAQRRRQLPWSEVGAVRGTGGRLRITDRSGRRVLSVPLSGGSRLDATTTEMLAAIDARLAAAR